MYISIFLAKAIGIYLIFISISFILHEKRLKGLMMNMMKNPALMLISGFIPLLIGILLVVTHNIWVMDWRVIITIAGWLALLKGMSIILFPEFLINWSIKWMNNKLAYYATFLFVFLMGAVLIYFGYIY
jgi:hypothetical protein